MVEETLSTNLGACKKSNSTTNFVQVKRAALAIRVGNSVVKQELSLPKDANPDRSVNQLTKQVTVDLKKD